jgi:DNA repair protein RadA/Sms
MAKQRTVHRCSDCGADAPKWSGRCPTCGAWNALIEEFEASGPTSVDVGLGTAPVSVTEVEPGDGMPIATGVGELDRVLGGGLVPGSVTLLGGEPGVGKSTLLLMVSAAVARLRSVLYVCGEERTQQVRARAERLGGLQPGLWLLSETALPRIVAACDELQPGLVVVDSVQTVHDPDQPSVPGSVVQVRSCAHQLVQVARRLGTSVVLVGHVTKDGQLAGPRALEHVVDTVLSFDGDRHHALRLLRATKHRFGAADELGLFELGERGLAPVPDPSAMLLADRRPDTSGSAVVASIEGQRPLLVEVQALTAQSALVSPRRSAQGVDANRLELLLAVLQNRCGAGLGRADVFVSTVGGVRLADPGADLAVCLALVSAATDVALDHHLVACGEVGLGGELRQVAQTPRRLAEAARLGFRRAVVPRSAPAEVAGLDVIRAATLRDALRAAGLDQRRAAADVVALR